MSSKADREKEITATERAAGRIRRATLAAARKGWPVVAVLVAFLIGTTVGKGPREPTQEDGPAMHADHEAQVWTCSMHPQIRMPEPGKCPICGMDLVPAESGQADTEGSHLGRVTLSENARALADIQTAEVTRTEPKVEIRLLGRVDYDETRLRTVTPWTAGRIDVLRVRVTGTKISRGQVVAKLYSPEIYSAMRDLVLAKEQAEKLAKGLRGSAALASSALESARERLRLLGVPGEQIQQVESTGAAPRHVEVRSPFSGTVLERRVEEGDYVSAGTPLFDIADLGRVWIQIDAYESDLPHIRVGQEVVVEVESLPDEPFMGKVAFIDPVVDKRMRTTRVRVEVENGDGQLRPGMFAEAVVQAAAGEKASQLVIPSTAPLFTGRRSVVYVAVPDTDAPSYELREVRLGPQSGPVYPVLAGLSEGERVVSKGAFVLDADLQLSGGRSMMTLSDDTASPPSLARALPTSFKEALRPVVATYVEVQGRLAADDFAAARKKLDGLAKTVNETSPAGPRPARDAWQEIASKLAGHARHAASATDEGEVRSAFEHISNEVEELLRRFGNPLDEPLRVVFCPMAFDSRGATWVQRDEPVENPYYGQAMLRCGEVRATVLPGEPLASAEPASPPPAAQAAGHQH